MSKPIKVSIEKSSNSEKKLMAIFEFEDGHKKTVHFGATGYEDYTTHHDDERKHRYITRHQEHEDWSDPTTAGALSRYILWNKASVKDSIQDFKNKFGLK